jgi:TolB protein
LAYIGGDGNVYVTTTADFGRKIALTRDAEVSSELPGLSYHRLAWSRDGWLAFASVQRPGESAQSKLYVLPTLDSQPQLVAESESHFVIYNFWSPAPCPAEPACHQLAYLIEEAEGIALRLVTIRGEEVENERIGSGWPFYYSWSPDGRSLLWHTGGAEPEQARLTAYDVASARPETVPLTPGRFMAPAWSPSGAGWAGVTATGDSNQLQYFNQNEATTIVTDRGSTIAFAWSPNGRQLAYMIRANANDPFYGAVHLYDLDTGQNRRVTDVGLRYLAFFWSPDGRKLGYLTWVPIGVDQFMQWRVYDFGAAEDVGFNLFHPAPLMRFAVGSFNQYAQSHRFWSSDGRYLVYSSRDGSNQDRVWVIDTWDTEDNEAIFVDEGSIGYWAFE